MNLSGGTLSGGTYKIAGSLFYDTGGDGTSTYINAIGSANNATNVSLSGSGVIGFGTAGANGAGTNALTQLSSVAAGSSLSLLNGAQLTTDTTANGGPGVFSNSGTITTGGSTGPNALNVIGDFSSEAPGVVNLTGTGDELTATGQFYNAGSVAIGAGDTVSAGEDYQQTGSGASTAVSGMLIADAVEVDAGTYDQTATGVLDINFDGQSLSAPATGGNGDVTLDGTLMITLAQGFDSDNSVYAGEVFDIMNWTGTENGNFANFIGATLTGGLTLEEQINGNQLDLVAAATPEPSTFVMMFSVMLLGAGGALFIRRRRLRAARISGAPAEE